MDRFTNTRGQLMKLSRDSYRDGLLFGREMALDLVALMRRGEIPAPPGIAALEMLADLIEQTAGKKP